MGMTEVNAIFKLFELANLAIKGIPEARERWDRISQRVQERREAGGTLTAADLEELNKDAQDAIDLARKSVDALPESR